VPSLEGRNPGPLSPGPQQTVRHYRWPEDEYLYRSGSHKRPVKLTAFEHTYVHTPGLTPLPVSDSAAWSLCLFVTTRYTLFGCGAMSHRQP
jgi:hypothetical protein